MFIYVVYFRNVIIFVANFHNVCQFSAILLALFHVLEIRVVEENRCAVW